MRGLSRRNEKGCRDATRDAALRFRPLRGVSERDWPRVKNSMKGARLIFVVLIVIVLVVLAHGWRECNRAGGKYVRGLVWMECIR